MNMKKHKVKRVTLLVCLVMALLTCQVLQPSGNSKENTPKSFIYKGLGV